MALKDQPYLPLYVQDVLTDEKLIECSAAAHGVYFRLLCVLHKQEEYGALCLKQKYKQNDSKYLNFAHMLVKQMPFDVETIACALEELCCESVVQIGEELLFQKRMVKDGELSIIRTEQGKKGGGSVTKQYGVPGYLYFMSDMFTKHKIGISLNPQNRLYRLRSDLKLPKHFGIMDTIEVSDMGTSEDIAHEYFFQERDGEWLLGDYATLLEKFVLLKPKLQAKVQANPVAKQAATTEYEYESENETVIDIKNKTKKGAKGEIKHKYGMYSNVLLTDDDLIKLKAEFPDWADRIDTLSEGIASKGYVYKNHLATIRAWARKDKNERGSNDSRSGGKAESRATYIGDPI